MTSIAIDNAGNIAEAASFAALPRGPVEAVRICLAKYFDFRGRASRSEFWWFWLFALALPQSLSAALGYFLSVDSQLRFYWDMAVFAPFFVPLMTAGMRRLHDIGRSGNLMVLLAAPWLFALAVPESVGISDIVGLWGALCWLIAAAVSFGLWIWWFMKPGDPKEDAHDRPSLAEDVGHSVALPDGLTRTMHRRLSRTWYGGIALVCGVAWALFGIEYVVPLWCAYLYWFSLAVCARFHVVKAVLPPISNDGMMKISWPAIGIGGAAGGAGAIFGAPLPDTFDGAWIGAWVCIIGVAVYMARQRGLLYFAFSAKHRLGNNPRIDLASYVRQQPRKLPIAMSVVPFAVLWTAQLFSVFVMDKMDTGSLIFMPTYIVVNGLGFMLLSFMAQAVNHNHFT